MQRNTTPLAAALALATLAGSVVAQERPTMFGGNSPFTVGELPSGQLRRDLERLPQAARERALRWLNGFEFPAGDLEHLRVDKAGGVYYADETIDAGGADTGEAATVPSGLTAAEVFSLHSRPGAPNVLFVDVDGHVISGTVWNLFGADSLHATAFDPAGDGDAFSATELDQIAEIWYRIAEDFSPFDVDITTEEPGAFGPNVGRVLITPNVDANGEPMPSSFASGVAYVDVFGSSDYPFYSPVLVYSNQLGDFPPKIAEAASHEAGHNLGLSHDNTSSASYYSGHGSGAISWGPIMGLAYRRSLSQWSGGDYADAGNRQDDIAIVSGKLGMRPDDHTDDRAGATPLDVGIDGSVVATTPASDPFGAYAMNRGVIGTRTDIDWFGFAAGDGPVELRVTPSWAAWPRSLYDGRGGNLDVEATLVDADGNVVARAEPTDETDAVINATLVAGYHYLGVTGVGNATSPYSDYGSQGQYFIDGSVTLGGAEPPPADTTAPTPDPMGFASAPIAVDDSRIAMTATTATDGGGAVEYYFESPAGPDSGWIEAASYTASGLAPATAYEWRVRARDAAGNETAFSAAASATTDAAPGPSGPPPAVDDLAAVDNGDGSATLVWNDVAGESSYEVYRESWHAKRGHWRAPALVATLDADTDAHTDASGDGLFRYTVRGVNAGGGADSGPVEVVVTAADGRACKGGRKRCGSP